MVGCGSLDGYLSLKFFRGHFFSFFSERSEAWPRVARVYGQLRTGVWTKKSIPSTHPPTQQKIHAVAPYFPQIFDIFKLLNRYIFDNLWDLRFFQIWDFFWNLIFFWDMSLHFFSEFLWDLRFFSNLRFFLRSDWNSQKNIEHQKNRNFTFSWVPQPGATSLSAARTSRS